MYTDHNSSPSAPSGGRGMRTPGPSFRPEGLRSVMSSPYLTALNQSASANRYQGESWDLAANQPAGRLHHTMSSPALESLGDHNYQSYNYSYQDNYGQYAEIGYRNGEQDPFDSYDSQASYSRRRNSLPSSAVPSYQGTPVQYPTAANNYSMSSSSSVHSTMTSTDGYGHMGIPDPRAPAFIPGTGYM